MSAFNLQLETTKHQLKEGGEVMPRMENVIEGMKKVISNQVLSTGKLVDTSDRQQRTMQTFDAFSNELIGLTQELSFIIASNQFENKEYSEQQNKDAEEKQEADSLMKEKAS
jgi:hypothetical protein